MSCSRCFSIERVKNGMVRGVQRYRCKGCGYNYSVANSSRIKPLWMKKQALQLYLEGLGFRSIGGVLGVSNVSVLNWIRSFGNQLKALRKDSKEINIVELDEMHSYIGSKKIVAGYGLLLIDMGKDSSNSLLAIEVPKPA